MKRLRALLWLALPALLYLLIFYWRGLRVWFSADDFAWLSQWRDVTSPASLLPALFEPRAQGSIRPLSERAFFLALPALFGFHPLPFRVVVFLTQTANLLLLASLTARLTKSRLAALLAPLFWMASSAVAVPLMWSSAYNQILCALFFFAALRCWIAYCDGEGRGWLWAQWGLFLAGFGALETIVMYPVIALGWRPGWKHWRAWAPMFAVSAAYSWLHQRVAPPPLTGPYVLHVDASMASTLFAYLRQVFGGPLLAPMPVAEWLKWMGAAAPLLVGGALVGHLLWKRHGGSLVPLALLLAPLIPVLPLRDHVTHYYLVTPAAGLAMALAWACSDWFRLGRLASLLALSAALVFLLPSQEVARRNRDFWYERADGVRALMLGLAHARSIHPSEKLVVSGLDTQRFYASLGADALRAMDLDGVYLEPISAATLDRLPDDADPADFILPEADLRQALMEERALVYAPSGGRLRNVTSIYRATHNVARASDHPPGTVWSSRVEPANPLFSSHLSGGWLETGGPARWMGNKAEVRLVAEAPRVLVVEGYCPEVQFSDGPFRITVTVAGTELGQMTVAAPGGAFRFQFEWPKTIPPSASYTIGLTPDHTVPLPDGSHASVLVSLVELTSRN